MTAKEEEFIVKHYVDTAKIVHQMSTTGLDTYVTANAAVIMSNLKMNLFTLDEKLCGLLTYMTSSQPALELLIKCFPTKMVSMIDKRKMQASVTYSGSALLIPFVGHKDVFVINAVMREYCPQFEKNFSIQLNGKDEQRNPSPIHSIKPIKAFDMIVTPIKEMNLAALKKMKEPW